MPELDLEKLGTYEVSADNAKRYRVILVSSKAGVTAESLEKDPAYKGAGLVASKDLPDAGGKAAWDLKAEKDAIEKKIPDLEKEDADVATFIVGFPGDGDADAKAVAGPLLSRKRLIVIEVELDIDPEDTKSKDDKISIKADDGSFEETKTVADDTVPGDKRTTLQFEVPAGRTYSIQVDPGKEGEPYFLARSFVAEQAA